MNIFFLFLKKKTQIIDCPHSFFVHQVSSFILFKTQHHQIVPNNKEQSCSQHNFCIATTITSLRSCSQRTGYASPEEYKKIMNVVPIPNFLLSFFPHPNSISRNPLQLPHTARQPSTTPPKNLFTFSRSIFQSLQTLLPWLNTYSQICVMCIIIFPTTPVGTARCTWRVTCATISGPSTVSARASGARSPSPTGGPGAFVNRATSGATRSAVSAVVSVSVSAATTTKRLHRQPTRNATVNTLFHRRNKGFS